MDYFIWLYRSSTWDAPPSRSWASPAVHLSLRRIHVPGTAAQQRLAVLVAEHIVWRAVVLQLNSGRGPEFWRKYWETNWQKYWETWEYIGKTSGKLLGNKWVNLRFPCVDYGDVYGCIKSAPNLYCQILGKEHLYLYQLFSSSQGYQAVDTHM